MKKALLLLLVLTGTFCFAQEEAWVYFKDKPDSSYYLANPTEMLSQKALDRREKQGIALDNKDVPLHKAYADAVAASQGITVMAQSKWLNALHIRGAQQDIQALTGLAFVDRVEFADASLNVSGRPMMPKQSTAIHKQLETEVTFNYGTSGNQIKMLNGHLLHQSGYTGEGMSIAVLDAGFPGVNTTQAFKRLRDANRVNEGYNYVTRTNDVYTGGTHGTLVLSTMAGFAEGQLTGTAPDADYYLFVTEDPTSENPVEESYWVEAAEAADSLGVDVINTSLGYFDYDDTRYSYTYEQMNGQTAFISRGADIAVSRGIFCVVSAGNSGTTADPHIGAPADAFTVLTIGAVDANETYVNFSSTGPSSDNRIKPDVMAKGYQSTVATAEGTIGYANGTSFASPITAGLVACLWQALPDKTNAELRELILQSADRYTSPNPQYGYGIPDFNLAMQNEMGAVNGKFMVYPNPTDGLVNLIFPKGRQAAAISIFNILGQKVMQQNITLDAPFFNISQLATGVYSYAFDGMPQTGRIIKQ